MGGVLTATIVIFALAMLGLSIGLVLARKELRRSCCGGEICGEEDRCEEPCEDCPGHDDASEGGERPAARVAEDWR